MAADLTAQFDEPAAAAAAIRAMRGRADAVEALMPAPFPEVLDALDRPRSKLGWMTFAGAAAGVAGGFALCIWTALDWPLVTGGKPIVSLPPDVIIAFELSVIVSAVASVSTLSVLASRARRRLPATFDPRVTGSAIGVLVFGARDPDAAEAALRSAGAKEVSRG